MFVVEDCGFCLNREENNDVHGGVGGSFGVWLDAPISFFDEGDRG